MDARASFTDASATMCSNRPNLTRVFKATTAPAPRILLKKAPKKAATAAPETPEQAAVRIEADQLRQQEALRRALQSGGLGRSLFQ
jgi:hypothetical protein